MSDKRQVLELTSRTFSWGDYWPHYFDTWLQDSRVAVLVAEVDGTIAGVVYAKLRRDGVAWLGGIRVRRDLREMGIGSELTRGALEEAKAAGMHEAWLVTHSTNMPAVRLVERLGFKPKLTYLKLTAPPAPGERPKLSHVPPSSLPELCELNFEWFKLTKERLAEFTEGGFLAKEKSASAGYYIRVNLGAPGMTLCVSFISGSMEDKLSLAFKLRSEASAMNCIGVEIRAPLAEYQRYSEVGYSPASRKSILYSLMI